MKKILTLMAVAGSLNFCQAQNFSASLTSGNEVPSSDLSTVDGTYSMASFSLSGDTLSVTSGFYGYSYPVSEVDVSDAPPGFNGPTLFTLNIDSDSFPVGGGLYDGTFSGSGTLTSSELTDLNNGDLYVNIQTSVSQGQSAPGEIRGQITSQVPEPATMALMGMGSLVWLAKRRRKI